MKDDCETPTAKLKLVDDDVFHTPDYAASMTGAFDAKKQWYK